MMPASSPKFFRDKLAEQKASSEEVKKFAQHMVSDHGKMVQEQQSMAKSKGVEAPKHPGKEQQAALKKLGSAKGEAFDKAYMAQMVKDHEKTLQLIKEAAAKAKDSELKTLAQKAAPDVEKHLQMAQQLSEHASAGGTAQPKKRK